MPFMIGKEPIRRTWKYLEAGRLILKDSIQIFSLHYNTNIGDHHEGAREFAFWDIPQVQYKNPNVQIAIFTNMTPSPFIRCFYDDGKRMLIDIDGKNKFEILEHLIKVIGKSKEELDQEALLNRTYSNSADIGNGQDKHCICEVLGQVPCPSVVPLPFHMRGKYVYQKADIPEEHKP
ncbi:probable 28S ribosomal protein S25, mitochondrial [Chelonus insularis]|uniref:probable 28S ribosomal protein S25, mitochondrial n=1 Tax=Chelonus insularis TaxID=460826 RepID=UPI00158E2D40|nr:probable 28S ribosomal protein S25, mitochondrial [Chelonus insularis]